MKKTIAALVAGALMLSACSTAKTYNGSTYDSYGVATSEKASPQVCYSANMGDTILSIVFIETIIVPIILVGWDIMEPSGVKQPDGSCKPN